MQFQRREDAIDARTTLPETHAHYLTIEQAAAAKLQEIGDIPRRSASAFTSLDAGVDATNVSRRSS